MLGAIWGDIAGSAFERKGVKGLRPRFDMFSDDAHFTDDTVMTLAVAEGLIQGYGDLEASKSAVIASMKKLGRRYPDVGYGKHFHQWLESDDSRPYGSCGNGSAMRVSPVAYCCHNLQEVEAYAKATAEVSHNHPEGIKGAQAVAAAIYLARKGATKAEIRYYMTQRFGYKLSFTLRDIKDIYQFDATCQGSIPQAIVAFLESHHVESAIRSAVLLGGDTDTQASIAGAIAEAYYGNIPENIVKKIYSYLPNDLLTIQENFERFIANLEKE